jgi:hypothetical protein
MILVTNISAWVRRSWDAFVDCCSGVTYCQPHCIFLDPRLGSSPLHLCTLPLHSRIESSVQVGGKFVRVVATQETRVLAFPFLSLFIYFEHVWCLLMHSLICMRALCEKTNWIEQGGLQVSRRTSRTFNSATPGFLPEISCAARVPGLG